MKGGTTPRAAAVDGDEQDVVTKWRSVYCWTKRPGATSRVKRKIRRRERQDAKQDIRSAANE